MLQTRTPRKKFIDVLKDVSSLISVPEDKLKAELDQSNLSKNSKYWLLRIVKEELTRFNKSNSGKEYEISKDIKNAVLEISDKQNSSFEVLVNGLEKLANSEISTSKEEKEIQPNSNIKTIKFISPELQEFLRNYRIKNKLSQEKMAEFLKISPNRYKGVLAGTHSITPAIEENLRIYFYKDYQYQITTALNTCIDLPCKNNISLLIYYISYTENLTYEEIAKKLYISPYFLTGLIRTKEFLTKRPAIALKELILNSPNLTEDIQNLCDEVLFCALIHNFRSKQKLTIEEFASQLNITYEELLMIEKTIIATPSKVKAQFTKIISSYGKHDELASNFGEDFASSFADLTVKKTKLKPADSK